MDDVENKSETSVPGNFRSSETSVIHDHRHLYEFGLQSQDQLVIVFDELAIVFCTYRKDRFRERK